MTITVHFSVEHPSFPDQDGQNTVDTFIDAPGDPDAGGDGLIAIVRAVFLEAKKTAVRDTLMVRGSYETEEAFEKDVARFAAEARISDVYFGGTDIRWLAHGIYNGDDSGDWRDHVHGSSVGIAEFQAKWIMATNEEASPEDNFDGFLNTMSGIHITECSPLPVTDDELRQALLDLIQEASAAGHAGPKLDDAVTKMQALGYQPQLASAGPRP